MIDKLKEAIALFLDNLFIFSKIILTVWLPGSLILVSLRYFVFPEVTGTDEIAAFVREIHISNLIETAFSPLYGGALIYVLWKFKQGILVGYDEAMISGAKRSLKLFATRLSTSLLVVLGLFALVIPGVILALRYFFIDEVVVLENVNARKARQQSARLTKGRRTQLLLVSLFTWLGILFIGIVFNAGIQIFLAGFDPSMLMNFVIDVVIECLNSVLFGLCYVVSFVFYWDSKKLDYYSESSEAG